MAVVIVRQFDHVVGAMSLREPFTPNRLFCPGPTPHPRSEADADVYHRSEEFTATFRGLARALGDLIGTAESPLILATSGTGAMEAAVVNLTAPGDRVAVVEAGKFGERWREIAEAYGCQVTRIEVEWGRAPTAEQIRSALASGTKALFLQANETSTGVAFPLEQLIPEIRKSFDGLIVVDGISSLGAHAMRMDAWGIDAVVGGSQKGFGVDPGLSFIALSAKARSSFSNRPRFYLDLRLELAGQGEGVTAFTPAIGLILAMQRSLREMQAIGYDEVVAHHERLANAARAGARGMGLELYPKDHPSNALTAIRVPAGIDGGKLVRYMRERFGMFFAGGQGALKGKIVRLAHLGFVDRFHVLSGLAALEFALAENGGKINIGEGVKAAMQELAKG